jgi:PilZ domain-containing protein
MEKRFTPRFPFVASAELIEEGSHTKLNCRVSELSLHGCYIDVLNTLPEGTVVTVKVFADGEFFESKAVVEFAHPRLGMGLSFLDLKPHFLTVLKGWLLKALTAEQR